jgi:hypothetical protein
MTRMVSDADGRVLFLQHAHIFPLCFCGSKIGIFENIDFLVQAFVTKMLFNSHTWQKEIKQPVCVYAEHWNFMYLNFSQTWRLRALFVVKLGKHVKTCDRMGKF